MRSQPVVSMVVALFLFVTGCRPGSPNRSAGPPAEPAVASTPASPAAQPIATPAEAIGGPSARTVIEEYSDFQCPYCATHEMQYAAAMASWLTQQKGAVRFDFYDVALRQHAYAPAAARAARCAGAQGRYDAARHALFAAQSDWARAADAPARLAALARATVPDTARFDRCLVTDTAAVNGILAANLERGRAAGIPGTPTFVVHVGERTAQVVDPVSPDSLQKVIRSLEGGK